jgi:hypothetical protein
MFQNLQTWQIVAIIVGIIAVIGIIFFINRKKNMVTLYNQPDFKGEYIQLNTGVYTPNDIKLSGMIKSIVIPKDYQFELYLDENNYLKMSEGGSVNFLDERLATNFKTITITKKKD